MGKLNLPRFGKKKPNEGELSSPTSLEPPKLSMASWPAITSESLSPITPVSKPEKEKETNLLDEIFNQLSSESVAAPAASNNKPKPYGNLMDPFPVTH